MFSVIWDDDRIIVWLQKIDPYPPPTDCQWKNLRGGGGG